MPDYLWASVTSAADRQFVRGTTERVEPIPPLFACGSEHRPDDGTVGCTGSAAEAARDLLLHLFGPHALFRQVICGRNFGIDREAEDRVPMIAQAEDAIVSRAPFPASAPSGLQR